MMAQCHLKQKETGKVQSREGQLLSRLLGVAPAPTHWDAQPTLSAPAPNLRVPVVSQGRAPGPRGASGHHKQLRS